MNYILSCEETKMEVSESELLKLPISEVAPNEYHILYKGKNYFFTLDMEASSKNQIVLIRNKKKKQIVILDSIQQIINTLGFKSSHSKISDTMMAPMPGLVMNIIVKEGELVKKGDPLIILEAMKMENILKAPHDGTIKSISVNISEKVEKNQLLLIFDNKF